MNRFRSIFVGILIAITVILTVFGFLVCYGSTGGFVGWLCTCVLFALLIGKRSSKLAAFLIVMAAGGAILWPIDASFHFPFLRAKTQVHPFGPDISVHPSPSGKCVAYIYNHSFLDSSYEVRFTHGLGFPADRQFVPAGTLEDFQITPRWKGEQFEIEVGGLGNTLIYNERTGNVSFPTVPR